MTESRYLTFLGSGHIVGDTPAKDAGGMALKGGARPTARRGNYGIDIVVSAGLTDSADVQLDILGQIRRPAGKLAVGMPKSGARMPGSTQVMEAQSRVAEVASPAEASHDPRARAVALGAVPGKRLRANTADLVIKKIATQSLDVFATLDNAEHYLRAPNFAGTGKDARELVRAGAAATVLGRLDELRYGTQG